MSQTKKDTDWIKYAHKREETLPEILKHSEYREHIMASSIMTEIKEEDENKNIKKRKELKARNVLLKELNVMVRHSF